MLIQIAQSMKRDIPLRLGDYFFMRLLVLGALDSVEPKMILEESKRNHFVTNYKNLLWEGSICLLQ